MEDTRKRANSGTWAAGKVRAPCCEIDAGQHGLPIAALGEPTHLSHHFAHGHRTRRSAAERDDAEGAAVVAAVLYLHERAYVPVESVDHVQGGLAHRVEVVDGDLFLTAHAEIERMLE
jgi:hypothetical protein